MKCVTILIYRDRADGRSHVRLEFGSDAKTAIECLVPSEDELEHTYTIGPENFEEFDVEAFEAIEALCALDRYNERRLEIFINVICERVLWMSRGERLEEGPATT